MPNHQSTADVPFMMTIFTARLGFAGKAMWIMDKVGFCTLYIYTVIISFIGFQGFTLEINRRVPFIYQSTYSTVPIYRQYLVCTYLLIIQTYKVKYYFFFSKQNWRGRCGSTGTVLNRNRRDIEYIPYRTDRYLPLFLNIQKCINMRKKLGAVPWYKLPVR